MNAHKSHIVNRTIRVLALGFCLAFVAVPESEAHTIGIRPGFVEVDFGYAGTRYLPGWLYRDRDFRHWYWHRRYHFRRHHDWRRLYHLYLTDRRHHRHGWYYHDHYQYHKVRPKYRKRRNRAY